MRSLSCFWDLCWYSNIHIPSVEGFLFQGTLQTVLRHHRLRVHVISHANFDIWQFEPKKGALQKEKKIVKMNCFGCHSKINLKLTEIITGFTKLRNGHMRGTMNDSSFVKFKDSIENCGTCSFSHFIFAPKIVNKQLRKMKINENAHFSLLGI